MSRQKKPRLNPFSLLRYDDLEEGTLSSFDHSGASHAEPSAGDSSCGSSSKPFDAPDPPEEDPESSAEQRALRLARIKAAIEAGTYETPDKLEAALDRLFEMLDPEEDES